MPRSEIASHGQEAHERHDNRPRTRSYEGQYGRIFRELPPIEFSAEEKNELFECIAQLGSSSSVAQGATLPAGYTYFGQFVAHDITFNPISSLTQRRDPKSLVSFRTPRLDLDSLYGRGPRDSVYFYDRSGEFGRLSVGWGMGRGEEDLARNEDDIALIGDPRNDENTMISQLHLAFIRLHNHFLDEVKDFALAQKLTCWHYQWVIVNDYLPKLCDPKVLDRIWKQGDKPDLRWYTWKHWPFIPFEFSGAALRFGHSMVRDSYQLNFAHAVPIPVFGHGSLGNLRGFRRLLPTWSVEWDRFLQFDDRRDSERLQFSNPIDLTLSESLRDLPKDTVAGDIGKVTETDLLKLNIERGFQVELPSGQAIAHAIGAKEPLEPLCRKEDPLWVYILREAKAEHDGTKLGEVGSTIVAETIIGLIAGDPFSYLNDEPRWTPKLKSGGKTELRDLVLAAGMPITKGDLEQLPAFKENKYDERVPLLEKIRAIGQRNPQLT